MSTYLTRETKEVFLKTTSGRQARVLRTIRQRDAFIVMAHYGLECKKERVTDIASLWELSSGRIYQIEQKVWRMLRHPSRWGYVVGEKEHLSMRPFYKNNTPNIPWS